MKFFVAIAALMAVAVAEEEKVLAKAVLPAFTAPLTYAAAPVAASAPLAYTYAAAPAITYAAAAPAAIETKTVEVKAAPALTYSVAAPAPAVTYTAAAPFVQTVAAAAAPVVKTVAAAPAVTYAAAAPVVAAAAPVVAGSQFHAQDELGNLNYGYSNLNSAKQEAGNTYAGVSGAYSYVDANGQLQQVTYTADAAGFRTADSRLPVAPTFNPAPLEAPVYTGVAPEPVMDTPEVAAARAEHLAALAAADAEAEAPVVAAERRRREADPAIIAGYSNILSAPTPLIHNAPAVAYAAPALTYGAAPLAYAHNYAYAGLPAIYG